VDLSAVEARGTSALSKRKQGDVLASFVGELMADVIAQVPYLSGSRERAMLGTTSIRNIMAQVQYLNGSREGCANG